MQPVFALSENTSPLSLEMNTRPPTTTGCARAEVTPGRPKAHFNFSRGTSGAVMPPLSAGTYRGLVMVPPQPFQFEPFVGSDMAGGAVVQRADSAIGVGDPTARPARNSATVFFSASLRSEERRVGKECRSRW